MNWDEDAIQLITNNEPLDGNECVSSSSFQIQENIIFRYLLGVKYHYPVVMGVSICDRNVRISF